MGITEEAGKAVTGVAESMKGTPVMFAVLLVMLGTLVFIAYLLGLVASSAGERNKQQLELIGKLTTDIRDCRQGPK